MYLVIWFPGLYKVWKVRYLKNKEGDLFAARASFLKLSHHITPFNYTWLNNSGPKLLIQPKPMNVTFIGNRVFADVIKLRLGHTGLDWDLNPMTGILVQEWTGRFGDTKDSHVTTKRETGVIQLQAKACQAL